MLDGNDTLKEAQYMAEMHLNVDFEEARTVTANFEVRYRYLQE